MAKVYYGNILTCDSQNNIYQFLVEENGKIVALIVPDVEALKAETILPEQYDSFFENEIKEINDKLANYSKIASFRIQSEEFEKTPKRSIKRFKYQK